jgi:hypothetical protein
MLERTGGKNPKLVNLSIYQHLFTEITQYSIEKSSESLDSETRLHAIGKSVGERLFDVLYLREKGYRRETKLIGILTFVTATAWKTAFGRAAELHETQEEYVISDPLFVLNKYASPPADAIDCLNAGGTFAAGFVEAIVTGAGFSRSVFAVFAHERPVEDWIGTSLVIKKFYFFVP